METSRTIVKPIHPSMHFIVIAFVVKSICFGGLIDINSIHLIGKLQGQDQSLNLPLVKRLCTRPRNIVHSVKKK